MPLNGGGEEVFWISQRDTNGLTWLRPAGFISSPKLCAKVEDRIFDFATRKRAVIDIVEKLGFGLALSPDSKSLLYSRTDSEDYEVMLVKNFH